MADESINFLNDVGIFFTAGIVNPKKGRINVPFSGAQMGEWGKSIANIYTAEQLRDKTDDFFSSGAMKTVETVAGAIALVAATAGAGSALAAPAAGAEAGAAGGLAAGAEGSIAPLAAETGVAGTEAGLSGAAALTEGGPAIASGAVPLAAGVESPLAPLAGVTAGENIGGAGANVLANSAQAAALNLPAVAESAAPTITQPALVDLSGYAAKTTLGPTGVPLGGMNLTPTFMTEIANAAPALNSAPTTAGWFASLSPGAQTALITGGLTAAQMGTGAMSGIFQGVSAQKRLELDQLINSQRQNQVQYLNRNNQYAPSLTFKQPSLANTVGKS